MPSLRRSALQVSTASAVCTLAASTAAVIIGVTASSIALVAFGAVQLFDFAADVVLVVHFRAGPEAAHLERVVLRVVSAGLIGTGAVTVAFSALHLLDREAP